MAEEIGARTALRKMLHAVEAVLHLVVCIPVIQDAAVEPLATRLVDLGAAHRTGDRESQ